MMYDANRKLKSDLITERNVSLFYDNDAQILSP